MAVSQCLILFFAFRLCFNFVQCSHLICLALPCFALLCFWAEFCTVCLLWIRLNWLRFAIRLTCKSVRSSFVLPLGWFRCGCNRTAHKTESRDTILMCVYMCAVWVVCADTFFEDVFMCVWFATVVAFSNMDVLLMRSLPLCKTSMRSLLFFRFFFLSLPFWVCDRLLCEFGSEKNRIQSNRWNFFLNSRF